ncbi:MAG: ABC transporter permease [Candidatus Ornithospirochaeta sp.]
MKSSISEKWRKMILPLSILFWILVWWLLSIAVGEKLFLPSPLDVVESLSKMSGTKDFWASISFSSSRIVCSYLLSFFLALVLGTLGGIWDVFDMFLSPLVKAMRSIPVASIVILALVWVKSRNLSVVVSVLVVFPILYESVSSGVRNTPSSLLEAAEVYRIRGWRKIRYIMAPSVFPYIVNGTRASLGLCWKSAVAAEVIGLPSSSVGARLYESKVYLLTADLFAWTVVIVAFASLFEKCALLFLRVAEKEVEK